LLSYCVVRMLALKSSITARKIYGEYARICLTRFCSTQSKDKDGERNSEDSLITVYRGSINTQVKFVKGFSLTSSAIALSIQPMFFDKIILDQPIVVGAVVGGGCLAFILGTPLLLNFITKRYVTELKFDKVSKTFQAETYTLFLRRKLHTFKVQDVKVPDLPGPLTSILVNNKPLLMDVNLFTDADAYEHLMGFDKPLDLHLNEDNVK